MACHALPSPAALQRGGFSLTGRRPLRGYRRLHGRAGARDGSAAASATFVSLHCVLCVSHNSEVATPRAPGLALNSTLVGRSASPRSPRRSYMQQHPQTICGFSGVPCFPHFSVTLLETLLIVISRPLMVKRQGLRGWVVSELWTFRSETTVSCTLSKKINKQRETSAESHRRRSGLEIVREAERQRCS